MDSITKERNRLRMQNKILARKLHQVCISHDHLAIKLQNAKVLVSDYDSVMLEVTARVVSAISTEEIETIYTEVNEKLLKKVSTPPPAKPKKSKPNKNNNIFDVFFGMNPSTTEDMIGIPMETHGGILDALQKLLDDIDKKITDQQNKDISNNDDSDEEDDLDKTDDLKPPF